MQHVQLWYVKDFYPFIKESRIFCMCQSYILLQSMPTSSNFTICTSTTFINSVPLKKKEREFHERELLQSKSKMEKQTKKYELDCTSTTASKTCGSEYKPLANVVITQEYNFLRAA